MHLPFAGMLCFYCFLQENDPDSSLPWSQHFSSLVLLRPEQLEWFHVFPRGGGDSK